jgi:hypothetical protein
MFRFNGFTITILSDKVIATQAGVQFVFKTVEEAMAALSQ